MKFLSNQECVYDSGMDIETYQFCGTKGCFQKLFRYSANDRKTLYGIHIVYYREKKIKLIPQDQYSSLIDFGCLIHFSKLQSSFISDILKVKWF